MARFKKKGSKETPAISTAALPDIVFMLLFFFMVSTVMREVTLNVDVKLPNATEIKKLEKKSLVSYIYVGSPTKPYRKMYGSDSRVQLNDAFKELEDIQSYVFGEREKLDEAERPAMIISLKADKETKMGIVTDIKQELRQAQALKLNYSAKKGDVR